MNKNLRLRVLIVLGVLAAAVYFAFPLDKRINLGLDLKGGMHLIMKVETEKLDKEARKDAVVRAIEIIRNRIDGIGVAEPVIQRQGQNQIIIQLPGITDRDAAIKMIGQVAQLNFVLVDDNPQQLGQALQGNTPKGYVLKYTKDDHKPLLIEDHPALKGEAIANAKVDLNTAAFNQPKISLTFNPKGSMKFAKLTREHVNDRLAIVLDGEVLSAPNINEPILSGSAEITGHFTFEEASLLALALRSGSLPAPMHIEEERTIGPLLGRDSINAGIQATVLGGLLVFAFMLIYYFAAGFIADIALGMNFVLILGTMGFLNKMLPASQVTLTLPGIAGIILTLGMAVDANVLINERIREEIENGRPLHAAISNGYNKAFTAIFDSNLTTLIAAFMLFQFGSGPIKGFAVTLTIGLMASLFTALFVTRTIFMILLQTNILKSLPMMRLLSGTKIDFVSKMYFPILLSIILIATGMTNLVRKGEKAYGIDFAGGQVQEYRFAKPVETDQLRQALQAKGLVDVIIQRTKSEAIAQDNQGTAALGTAVEGEDQNTQNVIIRTSEDTYDTVQRAFKENFPDNSFDVLRIEKVGPVVGRALRKRALLAILFALGGILIYVGFRFKHFDFATAGVIALLHDVVVALGLLVLLGRQVDLLIVTALLTIAGYSINDTIVIYDRIRENMTKMRKLSFKELLNLSINQTLGRTILTTISTLLVVVALYFRGGEVLNTFALCLIIGFVSGTYSTIFIATPLVWLWQKKQPGSR